MKQVITESIEQSQAEVESTGKVEKKAGKRVGYNYIIVKSYKESKKNDVVKCFYIKSLTDFGFCVIKEGSYGDTKDKDGRDIIDRLRWQKQLHEDLQDKIRMPRLLGHFEEKGNYYLVIEHIKGKALTKEVTLNRKELRLSIINGGKLGMRFLDYLIQIAELLEKLHTHQVVHRDATPNNYMITPGNKVALIDMEMCYSIKTTFPTPAFALGTYGYMSKQQEAISVPTTAEDIFAFGAIMLQVWSGVSPSKMTGEPINELTKKISFFIPDKKIAGLVTQCLWPEDNQRPNATQILQELKQYKADLKNKVAREQNPNFSFTREQILATVQEGIQTLATPLLADEDKGWFSDDMKPPPAEEKNKLRKTWYASYSHGASGVIYMLTQAKRAGLNISMTLPFIDKGLYVIKRRYINHIEEKAAGYNFGSDGIAAVLSCAIYEGVIEPTSEYLEWINILLQKTAKGDSVSHGIAGQGFCNLISKSFVSPENLVERLENYTNLLISKQDIDGKWVNGHYTQKFTKRKIKKASKGLMDGMSGIICFLLDFGHRYKHTESVVAAERGLKWLIKNAKRKKGGIHWRTSKDKNLNYDMASGVSGIVLCFIKAYHYTNNPIYKKIATAALIAIPENITDSNISQRYGLAGLGEVYLEAFQVFKEEIWLQRAGWLAQLIMQLKKQHPEHGVYWLVEHERQPVANFMIGNSGILHFLLRFCNQKQIGFPLLPE
jgi:class III lanthionine synthetase